MGAVSNILSNSVIFSKLTNLLIHILFVSQDNINVALLNRLLDEGK